VRELKERHSRSAEGFPSALLFAKNQEGISLGAQKEA
jgi:hypothetical protein